VEQIKSDIIKVEAKINLLTLDDATEENKAAQQELTQLVTFLENRLSRAIVTKPSSNSPSPNSFKSDVHSDKNSLGTTTASSRRRRKQISFARLLESRLSVEEHRIRQLTEQARADMKIPGLPKLDVKDMVKHIKESAAEDRIPALYLIDSIVKNVGKPYIDLFEPHVEGVLVSTFKHSQKRARDTVVKILREWHKRKLFPKKLLKRIYDSLIQLDEQQKRSPNINNSSHRPYQYNAARRGGLNVNHNELLRQYQYKVHSKRPDLQPQLQAIYQKLHMNMDITQLCSFFVYCSFFSNSFR